ncbi:hypothetical protein [Fibrella aquatilis]|uniref:Periplasmic heavy metal sensor n=1 Tax=Fibrella aquatilis TaxID=2817059 RepID=A0A939K082_9BACT|nr:hypothetical protein [Fibrella aquatilis]MBO0931721.1 hypothetical protein [Fibrella aquatilis]
MKTTRLLFVALFLLTTSCCFAQYGGYGGGYGRGGYGSGMGGAMSQPQANFKPSIPNVAGDMAAKETKWLKENLALTKEQAKDVKTLNNDYAKLQQEAIKEIVGADGGKSNPQASQQIKDAMMMYNEEKEDKLKLLLTPEQWTTYQNKKPDMQRAIGGIRPPGPKGVQPDSTLVSH